MGCCTSEESQKLQDYNSSNQKRPQKKTPQDPFKKTSTNKQGGSKMDLITQAFATAVEDGNAALAIFQYERYCGAVDFQSCTFEDGDDCLSKAIKNNSPQLIAYLLEQKFDVNKMNENDGNTPVHHAVTKGNIKLVSVLVKKYNGDFQIKNVNGKTPYDIAKDNKNEDIIDLFRNINRKERQESELRSQKSDFELFDSIEKINEDVRTQRSMEYDLEELQDKVDVRDDRAISIQNQNVRSQKPRSWTEGTVIRVPKNHQYHQLLEYVPKNTNRSRTGRLKRINTQIALDKMNHMDQQKEKLLPLKDWLLKSSKKAFKKWNKRYVVVENHYFLWDSQYKQIEDTSNKEERKKWRGHLNLITIDDIISIKSKSNNKFKLVGKDINSKKGEKKEWVFKATSTKTRDFWVDNLKLHKKHAEDMVKFLGE